MEIEMKGLLAEYRQPLSKLLSRITVFDAEDVALALELVDFSIDNPHQKDYEFFFAFEQGDQMIGYICFGPTPLTDGTYDLYWIAVDPAYAGHGVGTLLMQQFEDTVTHKGGRLVVIETSSIQQYELTRRFYLKNGYILAESIKDFYRAGEDRVTFVKNLT